MCPQGAARFADWFATRLTERYDGLATAAPQWLSGPWTTDARYDTPVRHPAARDTPGRPRKVSAASLTCDEAWAR